MDGVAKSAALDYCGHVRGALPASCCETGLPLSMGDSALHIVPY